MTDVHNACAVYSKHTPMIKNSRYSTQWHWNGSMQNHVDNSIQARKKSNHTTQTLVYIKLLTDNKKRGRMAGDQCRLMYKDQYSAFDTERYYLINLFFEWHG